MQTKTIALTSLGLFFGVVFAVNATNIILSVRTADGLVVDHEYEKALHYGDVIHQHKQQRLLGWQVTLQAPAQRIGPVTVQLADKQGQPLRQAHVAVTFLRPTKAGLDQALTLPEAAPGRYSASVSLPQSGMWDAEITVNQGPHRYVRTERVRVGAS